MLCRNCFALTLILLCLNYARSQGTNKEEMIDIATIDTNTTELQDLHKGMPETLKFTLNTMNNSKPIKLNLKLVKTINENSFVFVPRQDNNGNIIIVKQNVDVLNNIGHYQDKNTGGAFTVKCEGLENGVCNPVLFGSIHIDNIEYDLTEISTPDTDETTTTSPVTRQKRRARRRGKKNKNNRRRRRRQGRGKGRRRVYALKKRRRQRGFENDFKIFDNPVDRTNLVQKEESRPLGKALPFTMEENIVDISKEKLPVLGRTMVSTSRSRVNVAPDDTYNVELLLVIDHSIYQREYNAIQDTSVIDKDMETKSRIRQYFAHVVNGMDLRYDNIDTSKFHINVVVSGYIIADRPEVAVWTSRRIGGNPRDLVDSDDALDSLRSWRMSVSQLPEHDHMMLFTAHDLYRYRTANNKVTGLASFKAMCSASSVSVVEDSGVYGSISTGTHELAHSLGARHDGTDGNLCSSEEQYIMAVTGGVTNSGNELNPWKFSPCSINELDRFLRSLGRGNCLTDEALIYDMDEFNEVTKNEVGQVYNPNEQCRQRAGKNSFYGWGGGLGEFSDICTSMACKSETSENSYLIYTAARGTSCGNKKWCVNGMCTADSNAPEKDDLCVHGNSERKFDGQTCSELIREDPSRCYESYYRDFCCQSCKDVSKRNPGCRFGDKNSYCSTVLDRPYLCYSQRNQDICCDTCQKINTGYSECEYGDKVHQIVGGTCYRWRCSGNPDYQKACCKTCGLIPDTPIIPKTTPKPVTTPKTTPKLTQRPTKPPTAKTTGFEPQPTQPQKTTERPIKRTTRRPPLQTRPPTIPTTTNEKCVKSDSMFRSMTCGVVAKWISNICDVSIIGDACCEPCKTKPVENKCEDLDTCSNVKAINCYDRFVRDRCCSTCKSFETGDKDCMYGDRSDTCERYMFLWPDYICTRHADRCCKSCQNKGTLRQSFTILSSQMENKISNTLDNVPESSPFSNSGKTDSILISNDQPTRGDQIPIDTDIKEKQNGKGRWKNQKDKHKQNKGQEKNPNKDKIKDIEKTRGKDSSKSITWHIRVYRRPRVRRVRLQPMLLRSV